MNTKSQRVAQQTLRSAIKYLVALILMWSGSSESEEQKEKEEVDIFWEIC